MSAGSANQKGTVMGILRSLGALARALGPVVSSSSEQAFLILPIRSLIQFIIYIHIPVTPYFQFFQCIYDVHVFIVVFTSQFTG